MLRTASTLGSFIACVLLAPSTFAQTSAVPPADLKTVVTAPAVAGEAPLAPLPPPTDTTNAAISAGGQFATGNSRLVAASGLGNFDIRRGNNAFAATLGGNFSESYITPGPTVIPNATPGGVPTVLPAAAPGWKESTENLQAKLRYGRFFSPNFSAFLQITGGHDAFQAITFRLNVDPGVKLLLANHPDTKVWGELGYDFQFDDNYTDGNGIEQAGAGGPSLDPNGVNYLIQKNDTIHSGRAFAGFQHHFSKEVLLNLGLEYLQGFGGGGGGTPPTPTGYTVFSPSTKAPLATSVDPVNISLTGSRLNLDILLAAKLGAGLSFGVGFSAKYNSAPLAGKEQLDTASTLTLIYTFGDSPKKPEDEKKCAPVVVVTAPNGAPAPLPPPAIAPPPPAVATPPPAAPPPPPMVAPPPAAQH